MATTWSCIDKLGQNSDIREICLHCHSPHYHHPHPHSKIDKNNDVFDITPLKKEIDPYSTISSVTVYYFPLCANVFEIGWMSYICTFVGFTLSCKIFLFFFHSCLLWPSGTDVSFEHLAAVVLRCQLRGTWFCLSA